MSAQRTQQCHSGLANCSFHLLVSKYSAKSTFQSLYFQITGHQVNQIFALVFAASSSSRHRCDGTNERLVRTQMRRNLSAVTHKWTIFLFIYLTVEGGDVLSSHARRRSKQRRQDLQWATVAPL